MCGNCISLILFNKVTNIGVGIQWFLVWIVGGARPQNDRLWDTGHPLLDIFHKR